MIIAGDGERFMGVSSEAYARSGAKSCGRMMGLTSDPPRHRLVHRKLAALGARSAEIDGGPVALPYGACEERAAYRAAATERSAALSRSGRA